MKLETFLCDTCNNALDVQSNPNGITLLPRCVITANCNGKMSQVKKLFVADGQYQSAYGSVNTTWSRRPLLYTHTQTAPRTTWIVPHSLGNIPILNVYVIDLHGNQIIADKSTYTITSNGDMSSVITFTTATSGSVECIIRQFTAQRNFNSITSATSSSLELTQNYVLVVASKLQNVSSLEVTIDSKSDTAIELFPDPSMLALTPWTDIQYVVIDNQRYKLYAINMTGLATLANVVSSFFVSKINETIPTLKSTYILLANAPYSHPTDRNLANVIDIAALTQTNQYLTSIVDRVLFSDTSQIRNVYPPMDPIA